MGTTQAPGFYPDPAGGPTPRWWDGYQWTELTQSSTLPPAAKPKKLWPKVLIGVGVALLLAVGGCSVLLMAGGKALEDAGQQLKEDQAARQAEIMEDVTLGLCAPDDLGLMAASGTIMNNSSERSNYTVSVVFVDGDGRQVAEGFTSVGNVAPGVKADWEASSWQQLTSTDCRVVEVTRYSDEP